MFSVFVWSQETGRVKNYLGECSSKVTRQNGERSEILVSNPAKMPFVMLGNHSCLLCGLDFANKRLLLCQYEGPTIILDLPQVGRVAHQYHRGHGFESHCSLEFFFRLQMQLLQSLVHCENHFTHIIYPPQFTYVFHMFTMSRFKNMCNERPLLFANCY